MQLSDPNYKYYLNIFYKAHAFTFFTVYICLNTLLFYAYCLSISMELTFIYLTSANERRNSFYDTTNGVERPDS